MASFRISLAFRRESDTGLQLFADRVLNHMTNNPNFTDPPLDLADFGLVSARFKAAITAALDGGSLDILEKKSQRVDVLQKLRVLAAYVQLESGGDEVKALSSGFFLASRNTAQLELAVPVILAITNVASTKLGLKIKPVRNARVYEVWLRTKDRDWWLAQTFPNTRGMVLENLVPGTLYEIRMRAVGGLTGYSRFTDPYSHMST
jgi:Fibronectin type III domain